MNTCDKMPIASNYETDPLLLPQYNHIDDGLKDSRVLSNEIVQKVLDEQGITPADPSYHKARFAALAATIESLRVADVGQNYKNTEEDCRES